MATQAPELPPVSDHYLTQAGLAVALSKALRVAWPSLDLGNLRGSLPHYRATVAGVVRQYALASGTLAQRDYMRRREAAGIRSPFTVPVADPPPLEQISANLSRASSGLWDARLLDPATDKPTAARIAESAQASIDGAMSRLMLNAGRETTAEAVQQDRHARAWAREARPNCCSFCAMLASRGAAYKSEDTAGREANKRFVGDGEFKFHDHCNCQVVPVFGSFEMSAHARQWAANWERLKEQHGGVSLYTWRQSFEGRATTDNPH